MPLCNRPYEALLASEVFTSFHGHGQSYRLVQLRYTHAEYLANLNTERILYEPLFCLCLDRSVWAFQIPDGSRQNRHQEMLSSVRKHNGIPRVLSSREGSRLAEPVPSHCLQPVKSICL